jgi:hypothetical protein
MKQTIEERAGRLKRSADRMEKMAREGFDQSGNGKQPNIPRKIIRKEAAILLKRSMELFLALHGEEADYKD